MIKQGLSQRQVQKLSPQQIQLMKLLQVPTSSLEQRVKEEMEINPALEESDYDLDAEDSETENETEKDKWEIDVSEYINEDTFSTPKYKTYKNRNDDNDQKSIPIPVEMTFHEYLQQQLGMVDMTERNNLIAEQIIGSIGDDGYMRRSVEAMVDDLSFAQNIEAEEDEIEKVLQVVQTFEPSGVGCRTLKECLMIQLIKKPETHSIAIAKAVLGEYFDLFIKKHYKKLQKSLSINEEQLKDSLDEILKLNPKPASGFSSGIKVENYIIPDFIILNINGELKLTLNAKNAPDLKINDTYLDILKEYNTSDDKNKRKKETVLFIKQKIDSAKWFIDAIKQRQQTMLLTMNALLDYQYEYFLTGDETKLKPMILKNIAEITDLDISTISRVANSKYVQTEFGTFLLKSFFSESLSTEDGEEVSTREVKKILKDLVGRENKRKPLSDQKLTGALVDKGYNIARRTVAKYREQLNIPVARLRKEIV